MEISGRGVRKSPKSLIPPAFGKPCCIHWRPPDLCGWWGYNKRRFRVLCFADSAPLLMLLLGKAFDSPSPIPIGFWFYYNAFAGFLQLYFRINRKNSSQQTEISRNLRVDAHYLLSSSCASFCIAFTGPARYQSPFMRLAKSVNFRRWRFIRLRIQ